MKRIAAIILTVWALLRVRKQSRYEPLGLRWFVRN